MLVDWHEHRESVFYISFYHTDWGSGPPKMFQKSSQTLAKRLLKTKVSSKQRTLDQKCAFGTILNRFRLPLAAFGRPLGIFEHPFGTPNRYFWPLERSKGLLEAPWEDFEHIVAPFGSFWDDFTYVHLLVLCWLASERNGQLELRLLKPNASMWYQTLLAFTYAFPSPPAARRYVRSTSAASQRDAERAGSTTTDFTGFTCKFAISRVHCPHLDGIGFAYQVRSYH